MFSTTPVNVSIAVSFLNLSKIYFKKQQEFCTTYRILIGEKYYCL
jgi:hypothetical protein